MDEATLLTAATRKVQPHVAMGFIKTCTNSWATSTRLHLDLELQCVFGCGPGLDQTSHYAQCPALKATVSPQLFNVRRNVRGPVTSPREAEVFQMACTVMYATYHGVKNNHWQLAWSEPGSQRLCALASRLSKTAADQFVR